MSSIINAGVDGIVLTAGATASLSIQVGGATAAAFNTNGLFFRNRIINGDMRIAQRGTAAVTTAQSFPVDRFRVPNGTDGAFSAQQDSSAPTGFINSLKYTVTTADTNLTTTQATGINHPIEGTNIADFGWGTANARTVTLSFWVRSSLTGTFGGTLRNGNATRSYPFTYSISVADTWEYKTVIIPGDTSGTWTTDTNAGLFIFFSCGTGPDATGTAGSWASANYTTATGAVSVIGTLNATWYVTGVQLETGVTATPFERRPYGTELQLCQRYYQTVKAINGTSGGTSTTVFANVQYSEMRATPNYAVTGALVFTDPAVAAYTQSAGNVAVAGGSSPVGAFLQFGNLSGMTTGRVIMLNTATTFLTLSAEL